MRPEEALKGWPELRQREMQLSHDALMACMDADAAGNSKAKVESELARVQNVLAAVEEARQKANDEVSRLTDE